MYAGWFCPFQSVLCMCTCTSSISTNINTVSVKKTSNIQCTGCIQVVEIQITLQDGHHLVNHNVIHENLQAFVSSEGSDNRG